LIDGDLPAKEVAFLVSKSRKEWQQLGPSERQSSQALWERFNKACELAYEPCKSVFEDEAKIRQENYGIRIKFLDDLEAFVNQADWQTVNWVKVENLYQQSRTEWQNLGPVDKNKRKNLNSRFSEAHNALKAKLHDEWNKNFAVKEEIVNTAKNLVDHDNLNEAIQQAKALQTKWRSAGRVQHYKEKQLWSDFRESCDKIFARRETAKQQQQEDQKQLDEKKLTLCKELESLTEVSADSINENANKILQLKKEILAVASADKGNEKKLRDRVNHAMHVFELKQDTYQRIQQVKALSDLNKLSMTVVSLEDANETDEQRISDAHQSIIQIKNADWTRQLNKRLDDINNQSISKEQVNANDRKLHSIIIQMEILAEVETPAEDAAERLTVQAERLSHHLTSSEEISQWDSFIESETQRIMCGPTSAEQKLKLKTRHKKVIESMQSLYPEELKNY